MTDPVSALSFVTHHTVHGLTPSISATSAFFICFWVCRVIISSLIAVGICCLFPSDMIVVVDGKKGSGIDGMSHTPRVSHPVTTHLWPVTDLFHAMHHCYVRILKESGHDRKRKIKGWKCIRLIAINYHSATSTAGTECKGDRRLKRARQSESGTDSDGLTETQEWGDLEVEQEGQNKQEWAM